MKSKASKCAFMTNAKGSQEYETPDDLFKWIKQHYNVNLDVCASAINHKCGLYFDKPNGLILKWRGRPYCNAPYDDIETWVLKAIYESPNYELCVMLLPVRTSKNWFRWIWYFKQAKLCEIIWIPKRLVFKNQQNPARFDSFIAIFKGAKYGVKA